MPDEKKLLKLCLALKQLKIIKIGRHTIRISDQKDRRILEIDGKAHCFEKMVYPFTVEDEEALNERRDDHQYRIDQHQSLSLYLPPDGSTDWLLYNCLPTAIKTEVPVAIDAPYMLNTSREGVLQNKWNTLITSEVINAVILLLESKVKTLGIDALKYLGTVSGNRIRIYQDERNSSLQSQNFKERLRNALIIPTKSGHIVTPSCKGICYIPSVLHSFMQIGGKMCCDSAHIVDCDENKYRKTLEYLGVNLMVVKEVCTILRDISAPIMDNDEFRTSLYTWLDKNKDSINSYDIQELSIIPVLGRTGDTRKYVSPRDVGDHLYVMKDATESGEDFWVLNEKVLDYNRFSRIFGKSLREMDDEVRRERYIASLDACVGNPLRFYHCYLEHKENWTRWHDRISQAFGFRVKFKTRDGEFCHRAFRCLDSRLKGPFVNCWSVHPDWNEFAVYFGKSDLRKITYSDASSFDSELTDDDMEAICESGYFVYKNELIKGFIKNSQVPKELIEKYNLKLLKESLDEENEENSEYDFPTEKPENTGIELQKVDEALRNPVIVTQSSAAGYVYGYKTDDKFIMIPHTQKSDYEKHRILKALLKAYTPEGSPKCYCQMCGEMFYPEYMVATAFIHVAGEFYSQLYIAVCNRCKRKLDDQKKLDGYCQLIHDAMIYNDESENNSRIQVKLADSYLQPINFLPSHYQAAKHIIEKKRNKLSLSYGLENCQPVIIRRANLSVGAHIFFGQYYLSKESGLQPLEWQVISVNREQNEVTLVTAKGIDCIPYTTDTSLCNWKQSNLREWLNGEFYNTAFTSNEKEKIKECTSGFVRVMNQSEVCKSFTSEEQRKLLPTKYTLENGATTKDGKLNGQLTCWWWLQDGSVSRNGHIKAFKPSLGRYAQVGGCSGLEKTAAVRPLIVAKGCLSTFEPQNSEGSLSEEQEKIMGYLKQRHVTELVHFTPVENLESILRNGLVPQNQAVCYGGKCTDPDRFDGHKDTISLSVTIQNDLMMKEKVQKGFKLAILYIDVGVLLSISEKRIGFYPKNAALSEYRDSLLNHTGVEHLKEMFGKNIKDRYREYTRDGMDENYPTHPQAEILFGGVIPIRCIKRISAQGNAVDQSIIDKFKEHNINFI